MAPFHERQQGHPSLFNFDLRFANTKLGLGLFTIQMRDKTPTDFKSGSTGMQG